MLPLLAHCPISDVDQLTALSPLVERFDDFANEGVSGSCTGFDGCAFGGKNINFRQMSVLEPVGVSRYQALQAQLNGKLGNWGPFRNVYGNVSYALSRFNSSALDQDFFPPRSITICSTTDLRARITYIS